MKAIVYTQYGSPDVLHLQEIEKPMPQANEVLIKVQAASANPADWHTMRGEPFLARLVNGLTKPKHPRLGSDVAGIIEAVGSGVTQFKVGDEVFGCLPLSGMGSFAEYVCASESAALALKPANVDFEQAAAAPLVGFTAVQGLRDTGHIQAGQKVLVNGASGGVGMFAVQYAKVCGAEVTGVCSGRNMELVRSIGADHVVDYTHEDFTQTGQQYDVIYCAVGNRSITDYKKALKPKGICVIAGFTSLGLLFSHMLIGPRRVGDGKRVSLMPTASSNKQDLLVIKELIETGKVKSIVDKRYPLSETAEAIRYLETGRARGKVVINVV